MKKNEIKTLFEQELESHIPNEAPKIDWQHIELVRKQEQLQSTKQKKKSYVSLNVKLLMSFVFIAFLSVGIWIYSEKKPLPTPILPSGIEVFREEKEVLPLSFITTASLLPKESSNPSLTVPLKQNSMAFIDSNMSDPITYLKPFLGMIETLITQGSGPTISVEESDLEGYETLVVISTFDLLSAPITYQMYYNVISYEKEDDEAIFKIKGIMVGDHFQYEMTGEKEIEDDEAKITVRGIINQDSYIESIYETEEDESEYTIKHVKNGKTVYESSLKVEFEDDEISIEMEVETKTEKISYEMTYELEDGKPTIEIEFEIENYSLQTKASGTMTIYVHLDEINNTSSYQVHIEMEDESYDEEIDRDDDDD